MSDEPLYCSVCGAEDGDCEHDPWADSFVPGPYCEVLADAYKSLQAFLVKFQSLSVVLKDKDAREKLARAMALAAQAVDVLKPR
jgi:hypothetical protein